MTESSSQPLLRMEAITKWFGGVRALEGVSLEAHAGEVLAVCGENGAGKSTLMKILAGVITDASGRILIDGQAARFSGPREAEDAGIRIIHQELNLVPDLSATANLFLGRERRRGRIWLDRRAMEAHAGAQFDRLGTKISPRARVGDLRIGDQQMVEIAKALAFDARLVIMDEPTSALSDAEVERLFRVVGDLRAAGKAVVYISHKMNEVFRLADRIAVLRDGRFVASAKRAECTPDKVVSWMVGREIAALHFDPHVSKSKTILNVQNLALSSPADSGRPDLSDVSFTVDAGEVVGIAGLLGAGRTELLEALFGASPSTPRGVVELEGQAVRFEHPSDAIEAGVALVTEDRKTLGLFDQMTVAKNISICHLSDLARMGFVSQRQERLAVQHAIARLGIKTSSSGAPILSLSGGNQQKCILARWLLTRPRLLLLDEPTRGIDVGAKAEIYRLIRDLASHEGVAVVMTSSELPELLSVCDRILVLCAGRLTANLPRADATEEVIMTAATAFLERSALAG